MTRFDPLLIARYLDEFPDNVWVQRADKRVSRLTRYATRIGLTTTHELQRNRYHADFLSPAGVAHSVGLKITYGSLLPAYLASSRPSHKPPFESDEGRILLALGPHLGRALEMHRRIAGAMPFSELLNALPLGIAFA